MESSVIIAIIGGLTGSGFCSLLIYFLQRRDHKKDKADMCESARDEKLDKLTSMIVGLGHDRICFLGQKYIEQGYVTKGQFDDLNTYLYIPYRELGGNGTAEKIMEEVAKLPIRTA